jgi:hypothetical protein
MGGQIQGAERVQKILYTLHVNYSICFLITDIPLWHKFEVIFTSENKLGLHQ